RPHTVQMRAAHGRVEIGRLQSLPPRATGAVARSAPRQWLMSGPRKEIAPATYGPNSGIREAPNLGRWQNGVRFRARYIRHDPVAQKRQSIRGASAPARAARRRSY